MKKRIFSAFFAIVLFSTTGHASQDTSGTAIFSGLSAFEFGQFKSGDYKKMEGLEYKNAWLGRIQFNLSVQKEINRYLQVKGGVEGEYKSPFRKTYLYPETYMGSYNFYLTQAEGVFTFGDKDSHLFGVEAGFFNYKYNPDSRDLGEYLFRSTAYPQTIRTEFDFAQVRLLGFRATHNYKFFSHEFLLTSAIDHFPMWDWSITYFPTVSLLNKMVDLGAAISFDRLLSVNEKLTRPQYSDVGKDNRISRDTKYYVEGTDTLLYPFSGTKVMGRLSLDPKKLFLPAGENGLFGSEDLRIYSEAIILGLKNYPYSTDTLLGYMKIADRIPVMVGINIPAFRLLDVFSIETEYWSNPYPNSLEDVIKSNTASPGLMSNGNYNRKDYKKDDWKWSIYLRKTIFESFQVFFGAANDHYFTYNPRPEWTDYEEAFRDTKDWYWNLKFRYLF